MKNYLFYVVFVFIILGCGTQKSALHSNMYKDMYTCQGSQNFVGKSLNYYRTQLDYLAKFEYSSNNDTIYILEECGIQGNVLITIWNKNNILSYTNEQGYFESKHKSLFSTYMMTLVSEWNIPKIKSEEANSNMLPNELIYATKIIFDKDKYHIDCIYFNDFFNLERDGVSFCN